jgi:hypothetical protein
MDVKKLAGLVMAFGLVVMISMTAAPGTLAMIEVGLIGLLYFIRRRRPSEMSPRMRKALFEAYTAGGVVSRGRSGGKTHATLRASISSR